MKNKILFAFAFAVTCIVLTMCFPRGVGAAWNDDLTGIRKAMERIAIAEERQANAQERQVRVLEQMLVKQRTCE